MFEKISDPRDIHIVEGHVPLRHRYTPGVAGEAFFEALRGGTFVASPCDGCGITYCPPRMFCERCFERLETGTRVGPGGVLESFTIGYQGVEGEPLGEPYVLGLVRLDGADTVLVAYLLGYDETPIGIGDRVEAVFAPKSKRTGSILDLRGFKPLVAEK